MTSERDIERILDHWFTERPTQVADRVLDEAADRIARQPQQPAWRVSLRDSHVNSYLKPLLAVAAIVVVAVAGFAILRPPSGSGVGGAARQRLADAEPFGLAVHGRHRNARTIFPWFAPAPWRRSRDPACRFETRGSSCPRRHVQRPGAGSTPLDSADFYKMYQSTPANDAESDVVGGRRPGHLHGDRRHPDRHLRPDPGLGREAADWIEFLTSHPAFDATEPVSVDFGTVTGQQVELAVPDSSTASCPDNGSFHVGLLTQSVEGHPSQYGLPVKRTPTPDRRRRRRPDGRHADLRTRRRGCDSLRASGSSAT